MEEEKKTTTNSPDGTDNPSNIKQYIYIACCVALMIVLISTVVYCKDNFVSTDGIASRRSQGQIRDDAAFNKTFNLKELEKSVALINRKSGAYG